MDQKAIAREKRLQDIARGKRYFRKIDSLAQQAWINNQPRYQEQHNDSSLNHSKYTFDTQEQFLLRNTSNSNPPDRRNTRVQSENMMSKHIAQDSSANKNKRLHSEKLYSSSTGIIHGKLDVSVFNQWGSMLDPISEKLKLDKYDHVPKPRESIRFRDETRIVRKPVPKKGVPMSRVVSNRNFERPLKTNTDFRSQNGILTIIHPVNPKPDIVSREQTLMDKQTIAREKTTMMLQRIEKILHPEKQNTAKNENGTVKEEIPDSRTPCLSDLSHDVERNFEKYRIREKTTASEMQKMVRYPTYATKTCVKYQTENLKDLIVQLDSNEMNVNNKCQLWINRWICTEN